MINSVNAVVPVSTSHMRCISKLVQRRLLAFHRDRTDFYITLLQAPLIVLAFFLVFQEIITLNGTDFFTPLRNYLTSDTVGLIVFLAILSAIWFGTSKAIIEIPSSRVLYRQERLSFLKDSDYIISVFIFLSLVVLAQVVLFTVTFHLLFIFLPALIDPYETGLIFENTNKARESVAFIDALMFPLLLKFTGLMWLSAMASIAIAMLISVFIATRAAASAILPFVLIVQILMGGSAIKPVTKMNDAVANISSVMVSRWGFEAAILLFEQELNFKMLRYTTKHPAQPDFLRRSFAGTGALSLKGRSLEVYMSCLKSSWKQRRGNKHVECSQYQPMDIDYSVPIVTALHAKILSDWYQAVIYALDEEYYDKLKIERKNELVYLQPLNDRLNESVTKLIEKKGDSGNHVYALKNIKLPFWILDQATKNFYGDKGTYKDRAYAAINHSRYEQSEVDTIILKHAMSIDKKLKLFRMQNYTKTWFVLYFMTVGGVFLTWLFFSRLSNRKKLFF